MDNLNFEHGKKWKDTDMGKRFELHGHIGSEFVLTSEEELQINKELEEALRKYVRGCWEGIEVADE